MKASLIMVLINDFDFYLFFFEKLTIIQYAALQQQGLQCAANTELHIQIYFV